MPSMTITASILAAGGLPTDPYNRSSAMKRRLLYGFAILLLVVSVLLVVWQGSFHVQFGPANSGQTFILWAISMLIFLLVVTLGFILLRDFLKLYIERQKNREGSRIKTKLIVGALVLSCVPVFFLVLFSYEVLSKTMTAWFNNPTVNSLNEFIDLARLLEREMQDEVNAQAALLAARPETRAILAGTASPEFLDAFCKEQQLQSAAILRLPDLHPVARWGSPLPARPESSTVGSQFIVIDAGKAVGRVDVTAQMPIDIVQKKQKIQKLTREFAETYQARREVRRANTMLMALITLFVLFLATWVALFMAKQISVPISALLVAAGEVRRGNLRHRVQVRAVDELASLVRGFNQMTEELEANSLELDRRRRFTEAILESIPTGVLSIGADGSIQRTNRALARIFPAEQVARATKLEDLFSREDTAEIKYLMKRARRTGVSWRELELRTPDRNLHLSVTVSALEEKITSGFVVVLEDTSELLRAQKAAAWHEVARRVAHEIKNPLTPIALSAERISRQIDRVDLPSPAARIVRECAATITKSVESVKTLVDEFSRFARFPAAVPVRSDLNQVIAEALHVFHGRLDWIEIHTSFAPDLPPVNVDREQFQRVVINLVDNAAEAMQDSLVKKLYIATQAGTADVVEFIVADSGPGISPEDKEKLFLPYFSTKKRGTGLGLAIVSHILADHQAQIRVEDNVPAGARFTVEIPALVDETSAGPLPATAGKV
jgi:PAS domain S-box-containing protein